MHRLSSTFPSDIVIFLSEAGFEGEKPVPVGGGSISSCFKVGSKLESACFVKTLAEPPENMYPLEAESLVLLRNAADPTHLAVPEVLYSSANGIVIEYLEPQRVDKQAGKQTDKQAAKQSVSYAETLAEGLAGLHRTTHPEFGFTSDTYCGHTLQDNTLTEDGHEFFAERRLLHLGRLCYDAGSLGKPNMRALERLAGRLADLVPAQPASLIHGDLWINNQFGCADGRVALIDPAISFGWRESELALTTLFGSLPESFYRRYAEIWPMESGWRERFPLYNLYHLLNHLLMFGEGYLGQVKATLETFRND